MTNWTAEELAEIKRRNPDLAKVNLKIALPPDNIVMSAQMASNAKVNPAGIAELAKLLGLPSFTPTAAADTSPNIRQKNKYHVALKEDRTYNGKVYHSKKEADFAQQLDLRVKAGEIDFYLEQVPFRLPGNVVYRLDFMAFKEVGKMITIGQNKDYFPYWKIEYIEVKGYKTRLGELKRKQTESLYHIEIDVV